MSQIEESDNEVNQKVKGATTMASLEQKPKTVKESFVDKRISLYKKRKYLEDMISRLEDSKRDLINKEYEQVEECRKQGYEKDIPSWAQEAFITAQDLGYIRKRF